MRKVSIRRKSIETVSVASASKLSSRATLRASLPWNATRSAVMVPASVPRAPSISISLGAKPSAQRNPLSVPRSHAAAPKAMTVTATHARMNHFMWSSEHETDREVQPPALLFLAVGDVEAHRADGGAEARARAHAEHRVEGVG